MPGRHHGQAHQRHHHRNPVVLGERQQVVAGLARHHAAADIEQRPFAGGQVGEELPALRLADRRTLGDGAQAFRVAAEAQAAAALIGADPVLHILGNVHHHRTGAAGAGDLERRPQGRFEFARIGDQEHLLGAGRHDVEHRRFLERVGADGGPRHLAADQHHQLDPPLRRVALALVEAEHRVVGRQDRAAAVTEHGVDALAGEHAQDDVGAGHRWVVAGHIGFLCFPDLGRSSIRGEEREWNRDAHRLTANPRRFRDMGRRSLVKKSLTAPPVVRSMRISIDR